MGKQCSNCKQYKELIYFYKHSGCLFGVAAECKKCADARNLKWEQDNPDYNRLYKTNKRRKMKLRIMEYLGNKCAKCGLEDIPDVFDIHHENPSSKEGGLSKFSMMSWEKIKFELDKGVLLLCSNCHRKHHYRNRWNYKGEVIEN